MQGLRSEYDVHVGCPRVDRRAFLTGDAAADPDNQLRSGLLQRLPATQLMKDLLLGLLADRAGVEEQYIGLVFAIRGLKPVALDEEILHSRGIVFVHLTTVCLDVYLAHKRVRAARIGGAIKNGRGV